MTYKKSLGRYGEQIAAQYLEEKGYKILEKNFYTRYGEIDLICQKDQQIIFVEVKTRTTSTFGLPEESIDEKKVKSLIGSAQVYMTKKTKSYQIDLVAVVLNEKSATVRHTPNLTMDFNFLTEI